MPSVTKTGLSGMTAAAAEQYLAAVGAERSTALRHAAGAADAVVG